MRRAFVMLPALASACGLLSDFDALSARFPPVDGGIDAGSDVLPDATTSSDAPSNPDATVTPCVVPAEEGAIACEPSTIESLAVSDSTVVWIAERGLVALSLETKSQRAAQPRPDGAVHSTLTRHADTFVWGYDTVAPSAISSCPSLGCATTSVVGDPVVHLRKLAGSAMGLYGWRYADADNASILFSVGTAGFLPQVGANPEDRNVSHFTVSDNRAYWRDNGVAKHRCQLPACTEHVTGNAGQAPFHPLSGTKGFVSVSAANDGAGPVSVRICPDDKPDSLASCQETTDMKLAPSNLDSASIFNNDKAVAVGKDDSVYTGGIDVAGKLKIGKTEPVAGGAYTVLRMIEGKAVTALAVNSTDVFVAILTARGQANLYRFPQK